MRWTPRYSFARQCLGTVSYLTTTKFPDAPVASVATMGSLLDKNSSQVRKRIENHSFSDEQGEEYNESEFGGFGDYFRRKKIKLQNLDAELRAASSDAPQIFKGIVAHVSGYTQPPLHV